MSNNAVVLLPYQKDGAALRSAHARLEEAVALAKAINLTISYAEAFSVREIKAGTYLGKGTIDRLTPIVAASDATVVILACALSPLQQRNLEKAWHIKVIDKTALILEIFGQRARTREGVLQVELAHLTYARSRLVRSWTHLERQRGGSGFLGGPGETQIELDRRLLDDDIVKIKKELADVQKTRALHRRARERVPYPIVALVGYTNAGKSTLFNYLTQSGVFAKDMLFATLDPTMRHIRLPRGTNVILSDTVGFISELPHELVMAFRATLEEVLAADVVVHVRDFSHPDTQAQKVDVERVLSDLGLKEAVDSGLIEALNKIDLLPEDERQMIERQKQRRENEWPISAKTGAGIPELLQRIEAAVNRRNQTMTVSLPIEEGALLALAYRKAQVLTRKDHRKTIQLTLSIKPENAFLFQPYVVKERCRAKTV